ncbi:MULTISPECIES: YceI family protein [unclassified Mycolicibacterium]|uniref:YceI family protein n=1 Tax=unclassified Mycolicibacterium TaxID=2636767 RepID=UPI0012DD2ED5|nr:MULTISPECIES: YceI family protein [unclassified Mycolicibacterium]MUL80892.1 YceI family protein [Mycolicibacterium sp. CBMA 329]MUL86658.1 YceI family protein [Mycolicibacterium sp. CBMA 331]MUM02861.1 YceI family protein [Mycolicibacterium sp. CBMA 334]MUM27646.1 YceI family protein [Mycolicibacterium sp. CBMA 295]MUM36955.1 YceI family protein [Mycolicibacterium sp. CBMA 247]
MTTLSDILTASAGNWTLVPDRSRVTFRNKTLWGLATVTGQFTELAGEGSADAAVSGRVEIAAASLHTGIGQRDRHLRSADFFDVETHPDITIRVTGLAPSGQDDEARLTTVLTVRGVSKTLELPVDVQVLDDGALQLSGQCSVQRADFGVSGDLLGMVGPTTTLSGELVFTRD